MPNGDFTEQLAKWEEQASKYWRELEISQGQLQTYLTQLEEVGPPEKLEFPGQRTFLTIPEVQSEVARVTMEPRVRVAELKPQIDAAKASIDRSRLFYTLYSTVPVKVINKEITSAEDFLSLIHPDIISKLSPEDRTQIEETIATMIDEFGVTVEVPEGMAEGLRLPELVPPTRVPRPTLANVSSLTIEEIIKSLVGAVPPEPIMTDAEWMTLITETGEYDVDMTLQNQIEAEAASISAEWEDWYNEIEAYKQGMAELPDYKLSDALREAVVQPGLAMMEAASAYFEHVSMPLAGKLYKNFIPDIEAKYQEYKKTNSEWQALQKAWEDWEGPNWFIKYMLMEGLVDPLMYVGWGIATRLTRPIPYVGRFVAVGERAAVSALEMPFDLIKWGVRAIPKTLTQRAMMAQHQAGQYVKKHMERYTGRTFNHINMRQWDAGAKAAIKYALAHPQSESHTAIAGRELLKYAPMNRNAVMDVAQRLGSGLTPDQITKETVEAVNNAFDDIFLKKLITGREAAGRYLTILDVPNTSDNLKIIERLLQARTKTITNSALAFSKQASPYKALRALMRRNNKLYIITEESAAALARTQASRFSALVFGVDTKLQSIWRNQIDRMIVRPFAEAYLTFGMYGPMNVLEDYIRSALGGVIPRRMTIEHWDAIAHGLVTDPEITRAGMSEMIGPLAREGAEEGWNNWVLQLFTLGQKGWAEKLYKYAVRVPGGVGMDFRRNFVARRYLQLLAERGGDNYMELMKVGPRLPKLADRKLVKELEATVYRLKTSGNPDLVRGAKDFFTRKKIVRNEINNIFKEHPDLPMSVREYFTKLYDDDILFREGGKSIQRASKEGYDLIVDDFLRSPQYATRQMQQLEDVLVGLEVRNPQEMAWAIQQVNVMSSLYGATPRQIIAQATVRSRGLPLAQRRVQFDKVLDDLYVYLDKAGANIDRVIERLRLQPRGLKISDAYVADADRIFDVMVAKREFAREFRSQNIATRHEIFAGATPADMKSPTFWDDFYAQMDSEFGIFNTRMAELDARLVQGVENLMESAGEKLPVRPAVRAADRALAPQDVANLVGCRGDDLSRALLDSLVTQNDRDMFVAYVMGRVRPNDIGFTKEAIGAVYDQIVHSLHVNPQQMSWITGKQMELEAVRRDLHGLYNSKLLPDEEIASIGRYIDGTANAVEELMYTRIPAKGRRPARLELKREFTDYDTLRQSSMDEAHKWYYKEYTDYTNANAFDAMMKCIYPYWTYESQRFFWLPRSFIRHPGTFTAFERWQNNSDYGYIHIPGTSADINPFRGTIYGVLTTRLVRRDFPEYYDQLPFGGGNYVEFMDFLSRYGFYPGAHMGIPLAMLGGREAQLGEMMPATYKSVLDAAIATFPDNEAVQFISESIFSDRFRTYLTILEVTKRGYNGTAISAKIKAGEKLTEDEEAAWTDARREAAFYAAGFEQFGMFRLRTSEQYEMYKKASQAIEDMTGFTEEQQDWMRKHGYRLWDEIGGISPTQQEILQEMDYYRWVGMVRPLLPSKQQVELDRLELAWEDVRQYTESSFDMKQQLESQFITGAVGPRDYNDNLIELYNNQRQFIENKMKELSPDGTLENSLMTLEGRKEYYKKYNVPEPVLHPMRELLNLFFEIKLEDKVDEETGEIVKDWDTFWALREAIEEAIPEQFRQEWEDYLARNSTELEKIRRLVYRDYFAIYNRIWNEVLGRFTEDEQSLIKEFLYLERTRQDIDRQEQIRQMTAADGRQLVSAFRSDVSDARLALRYANPTLDAWLNFWARVTSFRTPEAEAIFRRISSDIGKL